MTMSCSWGIGVVAYLTIAAMFGFWRIAHQTRRHARRMTRYEEFDAFITLLLALAWPPRACWWVMITWPMRIGMRGVDTRPFGGRR